jgi:hypothetical protein
LYKFDSWVVAAAILARSDHDKDVHYGDLASRVVATELTTLGCKGDTPDKTLAVILRKRSDVFSAPRFQGWYRLKNAEEVVRRPEVANAIEFLKLLEEKPKKVGLLEELRREVQQLKERNALLEQKLAEIAKICCPSATAP